VNPSSKSDDMNQELTGHVDMRCYSVATD